MASRTASQRTKQLLRSASVEPLEKRTLLTATPLYWDPTGAATAAGGTGTWDTSTLAWRSGSPTGPLVAWSNTGDANGPFAAVIPGSGTITLGTSITAISVDDTASTLQQNAGTFSISGALNVGVSFGVGAQYVLAGGTLNSASLYIGCYSTASFVQTGGTLATGHTEVASYGTGSLNLSGGSSTYWDMYLGIYGYSTLTLSGGSSSAYSVADGRLGFATMSLSGTASLSISGGLSLGDQGGTGTFIQSGSSTMHAGLFGVGDGSTGVYNLSGGTFTTDWMAVGVDGGGNGTFIQSGGTATVSYAITIGSGTGSTGTYLMSGGSLTNYYNVNIGASGGNGSLVQTNGTVNIANGGLVIGAGAASASVNLSGGSISVSGNTFVGYSSPATLIQSGGTFTDSNDLFIGGDDWGVNTSAHATYYLSGSSQLTTARTIIGFTASAALIQTGGAHNTGWLIENGLAGSVGTYNQTGGTLSATAFTDTQKPSDLGPSAVNEGSLYTLNLSAFSPVGWWYYVDGWNIGWGDGNSSTLYGNPYSATHTYYSGGASDTINANATHASETYTTDPLHVFVNDLPAVMASITGQSINTGSSLSISTTFADAGTSETHTGVINWGDGSSSVATITESGGSGAVTGSHAYTVQGNYTPTIQMSDSGGAIGMQQFAVTVHPAGLTGPTIALTPETVAAGDTVNVPVHVNGVTTGAVLTVKDYDASIIQPLATSVTLDASGNGVLQVSGVSLGASDLILNDTVGDSGGTTITTVPLPAPTGLSAGAVSSSEIDLSWMNDASHVDENGILISTDGSTFELLETVDGSATAYQAVGLEANKQYTFEVAAIDEEFADDNLSAPASATTLSDPLNITVTGPTTLAEGNVYHLALAASPTSSAPAFDHWNINWGDGTIETNNNANVTLNHTFIPGTSYAQIVVSASTAASLHSMAPPIGVDMIPAAPTGLVATVKSSTEVDLTWTNVSESALNISILRSLNSSAYAVLDTIEATSTSYVDDSLNAGDVASYEVELAGDVDPIVSPLVTSAAVTAYPGVPLITSLVQGSASNPTDTCATLIWSYIGDDDAGFEVEMKDVTAGENFHWIGAAYPVGLDGTQNRTQNGLVGGDQYIFRIRTDYTSGNASRYVTSDVLNIVQSNAPSVNVSTVMVGPEGDQVPALRVGWSGLLLDGGTLKEFNLQMQSDALPGGPQWYGVLFSNDDHGSWPGDFHGTEGGWDYNNTFATSTDQGYVLNPETFGSGTYTYRIRSADQYGNLTKWSTPASGTYTSPDPEPSAVAPTLTSTDTSITVSWPVSHVSYVGPLLMQQDGVNGTIGGDWGPPYAYVSTEMNADGTEESGTIGGLTPGTTYDFDLWTNAGETISSSALCKSSIATTGTAPVTSPNTPDALFAVWDKHGNAANDHHASLYWQNSSNDETGFQLQRSIDPTFTDATKIVSFYTSADDTAFHDLSPDYNYTYYYRARALKGTTPPSGWSPTASLSPGPIIVMFYGADTAGSFPNGRNDPPTGYKDGNERILAMYNRLVGDGFQVGIFAAQHSNDAFRWLLTQLDTHRDYRYSTGVYGIGDEPRSIEIFGHSWGGTDAIVLSNLINDSPQFVSKNISKLITLDPVVWGRTGKKTVPSNVYHFWDYWQDNPKNDIGLAIPIIDLRFGPAFHGSTIYSNAYLTTEQDIYSDKGSEFYDPRVDHYSVVAALASYVMYLLEN